MAYQIFPITSLLPEFKLSVSVSVAFSAVNNAQNYFIKYD